MAVHDGQIWVVTGLWGVWRADLDDGQWTQAHAGLPEGDVEAAAVAEVVALEGRLYAVSADAIYVRDAERWQRLTTQGFAGATAVAEADVPPVRGLIAFEGQLLAVASTGLYTLDPDTGEHSLFWQPDDTYILTAKALPSGLYVGLRFGGVRHLPPRSE